MSIVKVVLAALVATVMLSGCIVLPHGHGHHHGHGKHHYDRYDRHDHHHHHHRHHRHR